MFEGILDLKRIPVFVFNSRSLKNKGEHILKPRDPKYSYTNILRFSVLELDSFTSGGSVMNVRQIKIQEFRFTRSNTLIIVLFPTRVEIPLMNNEDLANSVLFIEN